MNVLLQPACLSCQRKQILRKITGLKPCLRFLLSRSLFSKTGIWDPDFKSDVRKDIESFWRVRLKNRDEEMRYQEDAGEKQYVLSMFPYPSGALHMGHVRVYTISDAMARFYRLKGRNVLHPMGWDAFGLPAENAAIDRGEQPAVWTRNNIQKMKEQLEELSLCFDWDREYATCDPSYYRWTQYIFLKMYEAGLVYQKEAPVNWDPVDQTVLADEQIDEQGLSWRSGAVAERRLLRQWYIRTTAYSKSLVDGLEEVNPQLWRDIIDLQKHWIGPCDGVRLEFRLTTGDSLVSNELLSVFTRTPELVYGTSHVLLAHHHPLCRPPYLTEGAKDTVSRLNVDAVNPFTGGRLPVYLDPQHDFGEHLDAYLGTPCNSESDAHFAKQHGITDILDVLGTNEQGEEIIINSKQFSDMKRPDASKEITRFAKKLQCGGHVTSERARDWLISRQRYWGTPIPIIHCESCGSVPVPYEDLPVSLPNLDRLTGKGMSPLNEAAEWLSVKCPKCGSAGCRRETDTMDTFVDSSWYYLRYVDPHNEKEPFDSARAHAVLPVDLYIGGKEHAIMHLYYARFFNHFLHDLGLVPTREPFVNLLTQGMVMGQSYRLADSGRYIPPSQVDFSGKAPVQKGDGAALVVEWEKMSKSKYNGVDPQDVLDAYGTDSTRLCILSNVAPKTDRNWDPNDMVGVLRWQSRVWSLVTRLRAGRAGGSDLSPDRTSSTPGTEKTATPRTAIHTTTTMTTITAAEAAAAASSIQEEKQQWETEIWEARNIAIKEVTWNLGRTFLLNVAISRLHAFSNKLSKAPEHVVSKSEQFERAVAELVIMIAPLAPMFACELWAGLRAVGRSPAFKWDRDIFDQTWPVNDDNYSLNLKVKRGTKDCFEIPLPMTFGKEDQLTRQDSLDLARSHPDFAKHLGDLNPNRFSLKINAGYKVTMTFTEPTKKKKGKNKIEKAAVTD